MTLRDLERYLAHRMPGWRIAPENTALLVNGSGAIKIAKGPAVMTVVVKDEKIEHLPN